MLNAVEKKLKQVDPTFKTAADFNNYTAEEEAAANDDVNAFLEQMAQTDKQIRGTGADGPSGGKNSKAIFEEAGDVRLEQTEEQK